MSFWLLLSTGVLSKDMPGETGIDKNVIWGKRSFYPVIPAKAGIQYQAYSITSLSRRLRRRTEVSIHHKGTKPERKLIVKKNKTKMKPQEHTGFAQIINKEGKEER